MGLVRFCLRPPQRGAVSLDFPVRDGVRNRRPPPCEAFKLGASVTVTNRPVVSWVIHFYPVFPKGASTVVLFF